MAKGDIDLGKITGAEDEQAESKADEESAELAPDLLEKVKASLGDRVADVRSSQRLTDSASCLVLGDQEMALHLQRMLEQAGQELPDTKPVLELNPGHALVEKLGAEEGQRFDDLALVLFEQALLSEGAVLADPADFVRRVNQLLVG